MDEFPRRGEEFLVNVAHALASIARPGYIQIARNLQICLSGIKALTPPKVMKSLLGLSFVRESIIIKAD